MNLYLLHVCTYYVPTSIEDLFVYMHSEQLATSYSEYHDNTN